MQIEAWILAGGQSRRMGVDKLSLPLGPDKRKTVLQQVVDTAHKVVPNVRVIASAQNTMFVPDSVSVVRDETPYQGPLQAWAHAWSLMGGTELGQLDGFLLLAGDVPGLHEVVLHTLMDTFAAVSKETMAVLVEREGRIQPLIGLYRTGIRDSILAAYQQGERRLLPVIERVPHVLIPSSQWPEWYTRPIHTPEDYEEFVQSR